MATEKERIAIAVLQRDVTAIKTDFKDFKDTDFKEVKDAVAEIKNAITDGVTVNDKRYAAKWVQTAISVVITAICMAVIGALIALVVISPHHVESTDSLKTINTLQGAK